MDSDGPDHDGLRWRRIHRNIIYIDMLLVFTLVFAAVTPTDHYPFRHVTCSVAYMKSVHSWVIVVLRRCCDELIRRELP